MEGQGLVQEEQGLCVATLGQEEARELEEGLGGTKALLLSQAKPLQGRFTFSLGLSHPRAEVEPLRVAGVLR